jgi:hypothetical protein
VSDTIRRLRRVERSLRSALKSVQAEISAELEADKGRSREVTSLRRKAAAAERQVVAVENRKRRDAAAVKTRKRTRKRAEIDKVRNGHLAMCERLAEVVCRETNNLFGSSLRAHVLFTKTCSGRIADARAVLVRLMTGAGISLTDTGRAMGRSPSAIKRLRDRDLTRDERAIHQRCLARMSAEHLPQAPESVVGPVDVVAGHGHAAVM